MSTQLTQPIPNLAGQLVPVSEEHPPAEVEREKSERRRNYPRLKQYLVKTCEAIESLDKHERVGIRAAQVRCQAYYDGRQDGEVRNGDWVDFPSVSGEIIPKDNQYKIQIDKLLMEMCRADTKFTVEAADESSQEMREAAQFYQHRLEVNRERIENEPFTQGENMALLVKTVAFRYTYFDAKDKTEGSELAPVMKRIPVEGRGVTVCRTCGTPRAADVEVPEGQHALEAVKDAADVEVSQGAPCQHCGDTGTRQIGVSGGEGVQIDYEEVPAGRVVTVRPDSTMVQLDLNARDVPSSRFLRWRLVLRRCEWEAMFPGRRIPSSSKSEESNYRDDFQSHPSNTDGWGASSEEQSVQGGEQWEKIEGDLVWLDPVVYGDYLNKENERLPGNKTLVAEAPLKSMYPDGACVIKIGSDIFDIYPSNKNECWSMAVYGIREHALHGAGTLSLLGPQDTINDENAYIVANHYYNAAPREFVRDGAFADNKLPAINQVGVVTNLDTDKDIVGWAYGKSQPSNLAADVYAFRESQRGSLQEHAGTSSLSMQGAADVKALGTATGVEAARDQAVGRMIPNLLLKMAMQREWCYQVGQLERENYTPDRFLRLAGKGTEKGEVKFTARGVKAFFKSDPRRDFVVRPVPGSWMPTAPHQKKANASDFAQIAAQVQSPELLSLLAPEFGIEYTANEWGAAERVASMRLAEYARVCRVIESAGYPADDAMVDVVLSQVPEWAIPDDEMDKHAAFKDFLEDWWVSDEGTAASPLLRMVVRRVHGLHQGGIVTQAQTENAGAAAAQIPTKAAEVVSKAVDAEQQAGLAEDQSAQQLQQAEAQQRLQMRDREHEALVGAAAAGAIPVEDAVVMRDAMVG